MDAAFPPHPRAPDELAERLQSALGDGYEVEGRLGAGGFAVVYLVHDLHLKRKLAVKVLSPDVIASHSVLERFRREAQTVAQLSHPNIVKLHFIGQKDDLVYLVMEMIDGGSLAERLTREKALPIPDASQIFLEVAAALAHAHKRGVVHRDIKPQNVLIDSESGRALVTDFGIARTAESASLTATGMVVGTPAYLSPEQLTGEPSDHRADIFALGVMTYETVAGEPPFTGATPTAILMKRLAGPPEPLSRRRSDVPAVLEDLVAACLAPDPSKRPGDAGDIVRALTGASPVSGGQTAGARMHVSKRVVSRRVLALGIVTGAVIAAVAVALPLAKRDSPPSAPAVLPPVDSGMVLVPGGMYTIGSSTGPAAARPEHQARVGPFGIGRYEVTVADYERYASDHGVAVPWTTRPDGRLPVTGVMYSEAASYCSWRHPHGGRLPTEQEWEAAARGTEGRLYPWGRKWNPAAANVGNVRNGPAPVGSYPLGRTPEGVYDLIGNAWEWTSSEFAPYGDSVPRSARLFVIRGGGYNSLVAVSNAVFRGQALPVTERRHLAATGFRCAMNARDISSEVRHSDRRIGYANPDRQRGPKWD